MRKQTESSLASPRVFQFYSPPVARAAHARNVCVSICFVAVVLLGPFTFVCIRWPVHDLYFIASFGGSRLSACITSNGLLACMCRGRTYKSASACPCYKCLRLTWVSPGMEDCHMHYFSGHGGETYAYAQGRNYCLFLSRCAHAFQQHV
jgi:hypothetical protein